MRLNVENSHHPSEEQPSPPPKRSFFGKLFHGTGWLMAAPFAWTGAYRIKRSWSLIGDLVVILRAGPARDTRFKTEGRSAFDLQASAFDYGMPVYQLEAMLAARRTQTARIAYSRSGAWPALSDRLDVARAFVTVDDHTGHVGALFSAILRRFLPHGFLQCVAQLPDPLGQAGKLARVSGDAGWLLAELSARHAATCRRRQI